VVEVTKPRRRRTVVFAVILTLGAVAATTISQAGLGGSKRVQIGTGSVAALSRAARATDSLPAEVLSYPFAGHNFASRSGIGSRLLKTEGSLSLYAVPGKAGMVCLVEVDDLAGTSGGTCADRSVLRTGSIYMADEREDGSREVVGLVGDGHTLAAADGRRVPVDNNAFVLEDIEGDEVTIGSPTAEQTVDIGR
jgi:hypothetical protein